MLEVIQVPGPVAAFQASGTLSGEDYDLMTAELDRQLSMHERIGVYADMSRFTGFSLPALAKDLKYTLGKLGELHRFERVTVITYNTWLRAWVQLFWLLVPTSTVRICAPLEGDDALAWTSAIESEPPRRALRWIATTRPDAYAFAWDGTITSKDTDEVLEQLERVLESHISVRLLARIENMAGIRLQALLRTTFVRVKALGLRKVERYAIVARAGWLERYVEIANQLTTIQIRYFPLEREREAWAWIEAEPATQEPTPPDELSHVARA